MKRTLESRAFISAILAMAIGTFLFYTHPFPHEQIFLRVIALRAPQAFMSFKYLYCALLFTTPYLVCSTVLSGLYIFTLKARQTISPGRLPKYPDPSKRDDLFLVVGEVHNPRKPVPAKAPSWLTIPERGFFTGIAILGAIGSGKTSCCMLPFAEQILAYKAADKEKRIGGLILEVKGDFCRKVKDILERHQRFARFMQTLRNKGSRGSQVVFCKAAWTSPIAPSKPTSLIHSTSLSTLSVGPDADTFPKSSSSTDTTPMPTCSTTAPCSWPSRITNEHR
jgi:hypothetical protein